MTLVNKIIILCFHVVVAKSLTGNRDLGDKCGPNKEGECTLYTDCPTVTNSSKQLHELEICGVQEDSRLVICCERKLIRNKRTIRSSASACQKYAKTYNDRVLPFITADVVSVGEVPFFALVGYESGEGGAIRFDCGGTLISETFVLTAAHCLVRVDEKTPKLVRLGTVDYTTDKDEVTAQDVPVTEITVHPEYHHIRRHNDIGLVKLSKPVKFSQNVNAVCLYDKDDSPKGLIAVGRGSSESGEIGESLKKTYLQTYDLDKCNQSYAELSRITIVNTQLCALSTSRIPCRGDAGNPIYIENKNNALQTPQILVGLPSFGRGCGGPVPDVITRVSSYIDWIEAIVWP
ncbi:hypothetical protein Trydic_g9869 [Trypoxylus dichotomus]